MQLSEFIARDVACAQAHLDTLKTIQEQFTTDDVPLVERALLLNALCSANYKMMTKQRCIAHKIRWFAAKLAQDSATLMLLARQFDTQEVKQ